ncbi:hypothetical protein DFP73DRAFT_531799 [Morchella snyderi]|nr:hypothetical protein DFP73DRAFT_531799 [Morchella snyderi]
MSSVFRCRPSISRTKFENSPVEALRFLDLIDISIWANPPTDDSVILKAISEKIGTESARVWYYQLASTIYPRPLTLDDFRRALLRDYHVENYQAVMARYDDERSYFKSHEFLLKVSYHDSIEGLQDRLKFRDGKALEDQQNFNELTTKLESIITEKDARVKELESRLPETERAAKVAINPITMFGRRIEEARRKLKEELKIEGSEVLTGLRVVTQYEITSCCHINPCPEVTCNCPNSQDHPPLTPSFPAPKALLTRSVQWHGPSSLDNIIESAPDFTPQRDNSVTRPRSFLNNIRFSNGGRTFSPRSSVTTYTTMDGSVSVDCDELQAEWDKEFPNPP